MPARGDREIIGRPARARQRKVPPLLRIVHKALPAHGGHQQVAPAPLRRRDGDRRGVRLDVETIIAGAHIDTAFRCAGRSRRRAIGIGPVGIESRRRVGLQIDQREVDRSPGGMLGMACDVTEPEQVGLAEGGIVAPPGRRLLAAARPRHHVGDRARRAVAILHFQRQLLCRQFLLDAFQRHSDARFHHAFGGVVTRKAAADEIVRPGVANVLNDGGIDVAQIHETARQRLRAGRARKRYRRYQDRNKRLQTAHVRWLAIQSRRLCGVSVYRSSDRPGDNSQVAYWRLPRRPSLPIALVLMTPASKSTFVLGHRHLLGIEGLSAADITGLLDLSEEYVELNRQVDKKRTSLRGRTQVNLFFEASTRTQSSFEIAGKRLGADVMNMSVSSSSMRKGETLIDTAVTLNAMHPDILVVRHHASGAVELLARKVDGSVINAGDGAHEHPTQALLDALTIRRNKGQFEGLTVAICGDVMHSRVARSNIILLNTMGARVRVVAPSTLLPRGIENFGVEVCRDMREGLRNADIVMMLRLQRERMNGSFVPSTQEYFAYFGLDAKKLAYARPDALVMHPGPMNRGVEIDSGVADGARSLIREQVEMGVAVRMAVLEALSRNLPNA